MSRPALRQVRTPVGDPAWRADDYDDVKALLSERILGRAHHDPASASRMTRSALFGGPFGTDAADEAERSARRRRELAPAFSARRIEVMRPRVRDLVTGLVDDLLSAGPPADLHAALSFPLPVLVICELLGVPFADRATFGTYADEAADTVDEARSRQGLGRLWGYVGELVEHKDAEPADDVLSDLAAAAKAEGRDLAEVTALAAGLLFAGFETTVAALDQVVVLLMAHRDQWAAVCADPSLVPGAVEESLRCPSPVPPPLPSTPDGSGGLFRYASADLEGTGVRRGDMVVLGLDTANLDAERFPDPERFDVRRSPNPHLTFGHGARFCMGAALARAELTEALGALATRIPSIELAVPLAELRLVPDRLVTGLAELPVRW